MSVVERYAYDKSADGLWAVVSFSDGTIFEGVVQNETAYGLYISVGGDPNRLSLFTWGKISRVIYKIS